MDPTRPGGSSEGEPNPIPRLRVPPSARFGAGDRGFDLERAFKNLPAESIRRHGHMQKTLFKHGHVTTAIFLFDPNATIRQHRVPGELILHVLRGRIKVHTATHEYKLTDGQMLLIDPNVTFDLEAKDTTRLVMHVVLEDGDPGGSRAGA